MIPLPATRLRPNKLWGTLLSKVRPWNAARDGYLSLTSLLGPLRSLRPLALC